MVSKFLIRLAEYGLFPEVRGEIAKGLGDGIKGGLGKVAQGGCAAPGRGVAVINTGHQQPLLGHRGGDDAILGAGMKHTSTETTVASHLARECEACQFHSPVASPHRDDGRLARVMAP